MTLRVVVAAVMLGATVAIQLREGADFLSPQMRGLYALVGAAFLLAIVYALLLAQIRDHARFARVQLGLDLVLLSGIVLITGGVGSPFLVVYFLVVIGAGTLLPRGGSLLAAAAASALYGVAIAAPFSPRVAALVDPEGAYAGLAPVSVGYWHLLASFGFFLVALLSSHLAESLRRVGAELTAASASLAELERRSEHILQSIASGLVTTDLAGRITYVNRAAERIAGIRAGEVAGRVFGEVFAVHGPADPWSAPALLEGPPLRAEGSVAGGGETLLGMTFSPLRDEAERCSGVICAFQDLTRIRRMEEQVRRSDRLAAVGELAAGMAHEIRNPLAALSGSIQLLSEELELEGESRELMDIVTREVGRLNALITDFLQYASPRAPQLRPTSLRDLAEETARLLRQARGGAWRIEVAAAGDCRADADPQQLRQVFWNLALNAVEAMPGGGTLTITVAEGDGAATAAFADTGNGIDAAELPRIFTPFFSTKEGGTGLGLAVVFRIVEAHGGRVDVATRPGAGSTFTVVLPARAGAPVPALAAAVGVGA